MAPFGATNCRDRTPEFQAIVQRLQQEQGAATSSGLEHIEPGFAPRTNGSVGSQQSEFARRAARIGLSIHSTSQKLAKLTQLAKRTSMFDDPAAEINDLSGVIKQDLEAMTAAVVDLQTLSNTDYRQNTQQQNHSQVVIGSLNTQLKETTNSFKNTLKLRTENVKGSDDRRKMFSSSPASPAGGPHSGGARTGPAARGSLLTTRTNGQRSAQDLFGGSSRAASGSGEGVPLLQQQQQQQLAVQDTYYSSRADAMQNVESTIHELGGIFQQLSHMVHEQGEMAIRIDENMDDTLSNVENAQTQLLKYLNTISSNRWLVMKIFAVLVVFATLFLFVV